MKAIPSFRIQRAEFFVLLFASVLATVLFFNSHLDLWAAKQFYHPESLNDPWYEQHSLLWAFFYRAAPLLTGVLLLGSLGFLVAAQFKERLRRFRLHAVFVFLVVALGSGLVINAVLKPYWGRPRPREVIELGGRYEYRPFYVPAVGSPGKSFPCGHSSVGYSFALLWWLLRRRRPGLAATALVGSIIFGTLMGIGRIAAGGHFLSDVVWSALIVYWVSYWLYYKALKVPQREEGLLATSAFDRVAAVIQGRKSLAVAAYAGSGTVTVLTLLIASPFHAEIELPEKLKRAQEPLSLTSLRVEVDRAQVNFVLDKSLPTPFAITGYAKGFGFPGNKVRSACGFTQATEICHIKRKGLFSDFESVIRVAVHPDKVQGLSLKLHQGEVFQEGSEALPAGYNIEAPQRPSK